MKEKTANISGKAVGFDGSRCLAKVETEFGEAWIDLQCGWPLRLVEGDEVAMEDCDYYIQNGRIVTLVGDYIELNGCRITAKEIK